MNEQMKPTPHLFVALTLPVVLSLALPARAAEELRVEIALETVAFARPDGLSGTARSVRLGKGGNWQADDVSIVSGPLRGRAARVDGRLAGGDWTFFELDLTRGEMRLQLHEAVGDPAIGVYRGTGGLQLSDRRLSVTAPTGSADLRSGHVILEGGVQGELRP
jgi:hypothetical protein